MTIGNKNRLLVIAGGREVSFQLTMTGMRVNRSFKESSPSRRLTRRDPNLNWQPAQNRCIIDGAKLAPIHSGHAPTLRGLARINTESRTVGW